MMRNPGPTSSILLLVLLVFGCTTRSHKDIELRFVALMPAPVAMQGGGLSNNAIHNPTLVPFSGWYFAGADGKSQPWRKRSYGPHHWSSGGQVRTSRETPELAIYWRYPTDSPYVIDTIDLATDPAWDPHFILNSATSLLDGRHHWIGLRIDSLSGLPDRLHPTATYTSDKHNASTDSAQNHSALKPIDLGWAATIDPDEFTPTRIPITETDRFLEPQIIHAKTYLPGGNCLVDLDTLTVHTLPDPAPTSDELAKLKHKLGVDLIFMDNHGEFIALTQGCSAYLLDNSFWEKTPAQCVFRASYSGLAHNTQWPIYQGDQKAVLITTAEGSMVLLRAKIDKQNTAGKPVSTRLEVRHMQSRRLLGRTGS